jgi:hypothetical protein
MNDCMHGPTLHTNTGMHLYSHCTHTQSCMFTLRTHTHTHTYSYSFTTCSHAYTHTVMHLRLAHTHAHTVIHLRLAHTHTTMHAIAHCTVLTHLAVGIHLPQCRIWLDRLTWQWVIHSPGCGFLSATKPSVA